MGRADGHRLVPYKEVRAIYLAELDSIDELGEFDDPKRFDEVEWLVRVGAYVRDCWLAEQEQAERLGAPTDEDQTDRLWDNHSRDDLQRIGLDALVLLKKHRIEKLGSDVWEQMRRHSLDSVLRLVVATVRDVVKAAITAIGVLLLWWLIANAIPSFVRAITDELRQTANQLDGGATPAPADAASGAVADGV